MKEFKYEEKLNQFYRLLENQEGVIIRSDEIEPFHSKALIWFNETLFHVYAEYEKICLNNRIIYIDIIYTISIWLHFPSHYNEEDVLAFESWIANKIYSQDPDCKSYIGTGRTLLVDKTWNKCDLILTFELKEIKSNINIIDIIKLALEESQKKFGVSYSDKKEQIIKAISNKPEKIICKIPLINHL